MIAWFGVFVIWIAGRESFINFARVSYQADQAREPTWVPSPRAVPAFTAYCHEWFDDMAADWFDIDYSAFAYDRDFEEDLCIDDFSYDFLAPAPGQAHNAWERQQASEAWTHRLTAIHQIRPVISMQHSLHRVRGQLMRGCQGISSTLPKLRSPSTTFHYGVGRSEMIDTNTAPIRRHNQRASAHFRELDDEPSRMVALGTRTGGLPRRT